MLEVIILSRMRRGVYCRIGSIHAQIIWWGLSCFNICLSLRLPTFFVCADESDIWSTCISNSYDDFMPDDVVFHLCN